MPNPDALLQLLRQILSSEFGIDAERITPDAKLGEDLDLDSIDAIDLAHKLEGEHGVVLPESFESIRTVQDVLDHAADEPAA